MYMPTFLTWQQLPGNFTLGKNLLSFIFYDLPPNNLMIKKAKKCFSHYLHLCFKWFNRKRKTQFPYIRSPRHLAQLSPFRGVGGGLNALTNPLLHGPITKRFCRHLQIFLATCSRIYSGVMLPISLNYILFHNKLSYFIRMFLCLISGKLISNYSAPDLVTIEITTKT